jgi:hypothetical protein
MRPLALRVRMVVRPSGVVSVIVRREASNTVVHDWSLTTVVSVKDEIA